MRKEWIAIGLAFWILFGLEIVFAQQVGEEPEKLQVSQEALRKIHHGEQDRQLNELERLVTNLERRVDRLEDRIENLDRDLRELKRKI